MTNEEIRDMLKCETCGREFKSDRALKVHIGMAHAEKPAGIDLKPAKKKKGKAKVAKKAWTCDVCGKTFGMAAHLARHQSAHREVAKPEIAKPRKARKAKPGRRQSSAIVAPVAAASSGIDVRALTVDQLLSLKSDVDARLADIVKQMRAAKVAL